MEDMSPEEFLGWKGYLHRMLKPTARNTVDLSSETDWLAYFRNLYETGKCYVPEEFLTTIVPAYGIGDIPSDESAYFQSLPELDLFAEIAKDDFEWWFNHGMIMEEIRDQGFDPIAHPRHIAQEIVRKMQPETLGSPTFYTKGVDGKIYVLEIRFDLEEDSEREDEWFEARLARGDESRYPNITIMDIFEPGVDNGDIVAPGARSHPSENDESGYTFFATK